MCKIEFGFKQNEIQRIIIAVPKVLTGNKKKLTQIFDYLHNTMKVPHHLVTKFPQVFPLQHLVSVLLLSKFRIITPLPAFRCSTLSSCVSESATCFWSILERLSMTRPSPATFLWTAWCRCQMRLFAQIWLRPHWKIFICFRRRCDNK